MNLIQLYAPTADKWNNDAIPILSREQLRDALRITNKNGINIILAISISRREAIKKVVRKYDLSDRNDRRDILFVQFCLEEDYVIKNTYYDLPPRRLYIWKSPQDNS